MDLDTHPTLSVLIAAHNEGLLAHKTLRSVRRALEACDEAGISYEVICVLDRPTADTDSYFQHQTVLPAVKVITIEAGELSANRMAGISAARGDYLAIIDADDLCSRNWLVEGLRICQQADNRIVHTEYSINFGTMNILWKKTNSKSRDYEAVHNVQANRWDSALIAPRSIITKYGYLPNIDGFGSEDWDFNMRTLNDGIQHMVAPGTILFVRRKEGGSELDKQRLQKRIVRPSGLLALSNFRLLDSQIFETAKKPASPALYLVAARAVKRNYQYVAHRAPVVKKAGGLLKRLTGYEARKLRHMHRTYPEWLLDEWRAIHAIEKQLFPTDEVIKKMVNYDAEQYELGSVYKQIADLTRHDRYDYLMFVPYLSKGGADLVALGYANALQRLSPQLKICVVATNNSPSTWSDQLDKAIDFVPFGQITAGMGMTPRLEIIGRFISNAAAGDLHIINSKLAYEFVASYQQYIEASGLNLYACAFCEDIAPSGHVQGYIHTELPKIYHSTTSIFTDNQAIIRALSDEYGYDPARFSCHYIPVKDNAAGKTDYSIKNRLLWASRISYQKQPELLRKIALRLQEELPEVVIDVYGSFDDNVDRQVFSGLSNVRYQGAFNNGLYTLPVDDYDALLYTSLYDGIPNTLLEATQLRVPVITPRVGGIEEICLPGKTAFVVNDQQNVGEYVTHIRVLYDTSQAARQEMTAAGRQLLMRDHSRAHFDKSVSDDILANHSGRLRK